MLKYLKIWNLLHLYKNITIYIIILIIYLKIRLCWLKNLIFLIIYI